MKSKQCVEDLVAMARRGSLSVEGQRVLDEALVSSMEVRLLYGSGQAFDAARTVEPGDELCVERLAQYAVKVCAVLPHSRRSKRWVALFACAGVIAFTAVAAAAWSVVGVVLNENVDADKTADVRSEERRPLRAVVVEPAKYLAATAESVRPSLDPVPVEASTLPTRTSESKLVQIQTSGVGPSRKLAVVEQPTPSVFEPAIETAAQLFSAANLARRERQFERAIVLYEQLQHTYPESPEAREANLIAGKLQLEQSPEAALRQFRRFSEGASSDLTTDALWGQAQALRQLGRASEERAILERLVVTYPTAPYAESARRRLLELGR